MSCAQTDHTFPPEFRNRAVAILDAAYKPYHLQLFSGVQHGFALRCDLNKPYEREWSLAVVRGVVMGALTYDRLLQGAEPQGHC